MGERGPPFFRSFSVRRSGDDRWVEAMRGKSLGGATEMVSEIPSLNPPGSALVTYLHTSAMHLSTSLSKTLRFSPIFNAPFAKNNKTINH
jgi:hypothetical protein